MTQKYKSTFLNLEDNNFYYVLGAFMTDGSIYYNIKKRAYRAYLYSNDLGWLEEINKYFSDDYLIYKNRKCNVLTISSKEIVSKFIDKGCTPNKSLTLQFPKVPKKYLPDFIRGCIDGDGSLGIHKNGKYFKAECYLCSSSESFINKFIDCLSEKNIKYTFIKIPKSEKIIFGKEVKTNDHYRVKIMGKENLINFLKWIYYDKHNLSLKRKFMKVLNIVNQ